MQNIRDGSSQYGTSGWTGSRCTVQGGGVWPDAIHHLNRTWERVHHRSTCWSRWECGPHHTEPTKGCLTLPLASHCPSPPPVSTPTSLTSTSSIPFTPSPVHCHPSIRTFNVGIARLMRSRSLCGWTGCARSTTLDHRARGCDVDQCSAALPILVRAVLCCMVELWPRAPLPNPTVVTLPVFTGNH